MSVRTYRAKSMRDALDQVRRDLGPDASVLHTRELRGGILRWLTVGREIEITASNTVEVPSRLPTELREEFELADSRNATEGVPYSATGGVAYSATEGVSYSAKGISRTADRSALPDVPPAHEQDFGAQFRRDLRESKAELDPMVEDLCRENDEAASYHLPEHLFCLMRELLAAEVPEEIARELVTRPGVSLPADEYQDPLLLKARAARLLEDEIEINGPIRITPGRRRLVALVGPTGVGKTTTIAKLAANFRLREKRSVGLITVDTYRIAAVDQLRTYADIIDLPMAVVSTPREMREAVDRLAKLDLILLDTAGRSPRDEVRIQELKSLLAEAQPDEIHLVLSAAAGSYGLANVIERFAAVGASALVLTKLDEAAALGTLLPLLRSCRLPLSYVTSGQNVPDDIDPADRRRLARLLLGMEPGNA